ncbi:UDP-N-acetylmuramoyl-L-alanyl-D-glutamate--2,6-diaminopimelate ligase [Candidatus Nomurabacteria bacterium]|nr:UDP-N-acetylmuramoyl-L-alanyl-D-glutamate--2,6-diaminopimelate ligase [Candidatus Nomurabacteria bacterium]
MFEKLKKIYHYSLALAGALIYQFPSRKIKVIAVTGTKGKTSTVEIINAILEEAGYQTVISSTLRFKVGEESVNNRRKMTMPGRLFLQKILRRGVNAGCDYAVVEMTSEGAKQFRHKFIELDALVFTNIAPEHIESHGSYENYLKAKLAIAHQLSRSKKSPRFIVVNGDDKEHTKFLQAAGKDAQKVVYKLSDNETLKLHTRLPGEFNLYNVLAAARLAETQGVGPEIIQETLNNFAGIRGRMEPVGRQEFDVIVDYAHTPDSLRAAYKALNNKRKICVLGGTGGGRDHWKRPLMGQIASENCDRIFLTDEDPYDENPEEIVKQVASGIKSNNYKVIMDRREAIREAVRIAQPGDVIIITGKGTDPYIMGANGKKTPWDDATVAHEELEKLRDARTTRS